MQQSDSELAIVRHDEIQFIFPEKLKKIKWCILWTLN